MLFILRFQLHIMQNARKDINILRFDVGQTIETIRCYIEQTILRFYITYFEYLVNLMHK